MGRLGTIFGAAAIAANFAGSVQAQDSDAITTVVNGVDGRVQLYDLPDNYFKNFFADPEDILKTNGNIKPSIELYDSVGPVDERKAVKMGMRAYNPVLQMMDSNGNSFCTATIVTIDGFEIRDPGTIIAMAAHCISDRNEDDNIIGVMKPQDIFFKGSYLDEFGFYKEFIWRGDEVWMDPLYLENDLADKEHLKDHGEIKDKVLEADSALIYSRQLTPDEVVPARLIPMDYNSSLELISQIKVAQDAGKFPVFTVAGHSSDKPYLTTHEEASIVAGDATGVIMNADIVPGASGGPVFYAGFYSNDPIQFDQNGQPFMLAVNSTVDTEILIDQSNNTTQYILSERSRHSYFNKDMLSAVPFLKEPNQGRHEFCFQSGEVLVDDLNIRVDPDVDAQFLARKDGQTTSKLDRGTILDVHGTTKNHLGEIWALVTTEFNNTGYVIVENDGKNYVRIDQKGCVDLSP